MPDKPYIPPLPPGVERKQRHISDPTGGIVISALFPASIAQGMYRVAEKRGMKNVSELLRQVVMNNKKLIREIEDSRPLELIS